MRLQGLLVFVDRVLRGYSRLPTIRMSSGGQAMREFCRMPLTPDFVARRLKELRDRQRQHATFRRQLGRGLLEAGHCLVRARAQGEISGQRH